MREFFVTVHRWAGLFTAVFLLIAGLTGALISWDHELDEWLNPHLYTATEDGAPLPPLELVRRFEALHPQGKVTSFQLAFEKGHTADLFVEPRVDPRTGELFKLDYNQAFVDPASGAVVGKRYWGRISLNSEDILPFLYKLHYSMHIPDFNNFDRWGIWFMGIVGIVWMFDCFVGLYLTLPKRRREGRALFAPAGFGREDVAEWWRRWQPAWMIKRGASAYRLNFDLHRAFGLWLWLMLLIIAFTSISMNLNEEVVRPILSKISTLTPDVSDGREEAPLNRPIAPDVPFSNAIETAVVEREKRSWQEPPGSTWYDQSHGIYGVSFFEAGDDHGSAGMGVKTLYVDGKTGAVLGDSVPWKGTAADIFMQLQFPIHSGRIAGVPGRVFLSFMGLVIAMLSLTGIVIWFRKRQARLRVRLGLEPASGVLASRGTFGSRLLTLVNAASAPFAGADASARLVAERISTRSSRLSEVSGPTARDAAGIVADLARFVLALTMLAIAHAARMMYAEAAPRASRAMALARAKSAPIRAQAISQLTSMRTQAVALARPRIDAASVAFRKLRDGTRSD